jgi:DNA-directed RNA polymerase subunit K/omega
MPRKSKKKANNEDDAYEDDIEKKNDSEEEEVVEEEEEEEEEDENDYDDKLTENSDSDNECDIDAIIKDDNDYFGNDEDEKEILNENLNSHEYITGDKRISSNRLTRYEMTAILGLRTKQLKMGAKPLIKNFKGLPYDKIAEEEFKLNMTPFKIKRPLPNGKFEIWTLDELSKDHLLYVL